jgi:methylmalonyl-CoA mutase cobalamin-binding domain/chain
MEGAASAVRRALNAGIPSDQILKEGVSKGMEDVGRKFETCEYFISELVMAGEVAKTAVAILEPYLERKIGEALGTMVLGTVSGDIHNIGKDIFATLARSAGFDVIDLGVDVPAEKFVDGVKRHNANILGLSSLLTTTMTCVSEVVKAIEQAGLRKTVKIISGGAPITDDYAKKAGADAGVNDAILGLEICKEWANGS